MERDPVTKPIGLYDRLLPLASLAAAALLLFIGLRQGGLLAPYDRLAAALAVGGALWLVVMWKSPAAFQRWEARLDGIDERTVWKGAWGLAALYAVILSVYVVVRHLLFNSGGFDLAIQEQVVWSTANGRLFGSSLEVFHYFGDHVSPFLAYLAPVYRLWQDPIVLLLIQTLSLATCGPAAYRLAQRHTGRPWVGLAACALLLLLPAIGFMNRYDVHAIAFATPLLLWCVVWAEEGRLWWSRSAALLALSTKEDVGLAVALLALVLWIRGRWGREALLWIVGGITWSFLAFLVVLPHFREGLSADTLGRYAYLGSNPGEIVRTLVTRPHEVFLDLFSKEIRILYLFQLLLPFAGRPILRPFLLLPLLPALAYNLLSTNYSQVSIYFQYMALLVPFLVWGTVASLPARNAVAGRSLKVVLALLIGTVGANVVDPALVARIDSPYAEVHGWERWIDGEVFEEMAARIGPGESVTASDALAPHLARREKLWVYRGGTDMPATDWYLVALWNRRDLERPEVTLADLGERLESGDYGVAAFESGLVLMRRDSPGDSTATRRFLHAAAENPS